MFSKINDTIIKGYVKADLAMTEAAERHHDKLKRVGTPMAVFGLLMMTADAALAAGGMGGWVKGVIQDTGVPVLEGVMWGGYAIGVTGVGVGINKFVQMSKPNGQASPKEAFSYLGGGGGLMALGYISDRMVESFANGGSTSFGVKTL